MFEIDLTDKNSILSAFEDTDESTDIFEENPENNLILAEAMFIDNLTSQEIEELNEDSKQLSQLVDEEILAEKSIVKLDKKAKTRKVETQAEILIAKERGDRDFNKLVRLYKMKRIILEKFHNKYGAQARARAKKMMKRSAKSKSPYAKKVAARAK